MPEQFHSQVPEHLLENETPAMRYLVMELSKNTQATEFLLAKREESGKTLDEINNKLTQVDDKLKFTNGKIANAMIQIKQLEEKNEADKEIEQEVKEMVSFKLFAEKYLFNKHALIIVLIFGIGFIKVLSNDELRGYLFRAIGIL